MLIPGGTLNSGSIQADPQDLSDRGSLLKMATGAGPAWLSMAAKVLCLVRYVRGRSGYFGTGRKVVCSEASRGD